MLDNSLKTKIEQNRLRHRIFFDKRHRHRFLDNRGFRPWGIFLSSTVSRLLCRYKCRNFLVISPPEFSCTERKNIFLER